MKLHLAVSALVASSSVGVHVSFAQMMSDNGASVSSVTFSDISDRLGPFVNGPTNVNEGTGQSSGLQGMIFFDYDNDEDLDLFICAESPVTAALFANNGDGTFQDVTDSAGLSGITDCQGVTVGDLDNDGFPELFITGDLSKNGAFLYRNVGGSSFEDISASSGVVSVPYNWGNAMADYDNDGFVDLYMGAGNFGRDVLYRNNGDLTFTDVSEQAGLRQDNGLLDDGNSNTCGVAFADLNSNGFQDIITSNCDNSPGLPATLYSNNGDGTYSEPVALPSINQFGFYMGIGIGDIDKDGDYDIFITDIGSNEYFSPHSLLLNDGDNNFVDATPADLPVQEWGWSASFADHDNDGDLDLLYTGSGIFTTLVNFNRGRLMLNDGTGALTEAESCPPVDCTTCIANDAANDFTGVQPDLCFTSDFCALRDDATGMWSGEAEVCNVIAVGCDSCYRGKSECAFDVEEPECIRALGVDLVTSRSSGHAIGDIDGDGFDDIAIMTADYSKDYAVFFEQQGYLMPGAITNVVLLKNSGNDNNSIRLKLVGTNSNNNGIGALLTCDDGSGSTQYLQQRAVSGPYSSSQYFPTFGIGKMEEATITVRWPSGLSETFSNVQANMLTTLEEGTGTAVEDDGDMGSPPSPGGTPSPDDLSDPVAIITAFAACVSPNNATDVDEVCVANVFATYEVSPALAAELNDCFMAGGTFEEIKQCALDGVASLPDEGMAPTSAPTDDNAVPPTDDTTSDASILSRLGVFSWALLLVAATLF